jgi:hypothetical protein
MAFHDFLKLSRLSGLFRPARSAAPRFGFGGKGVSAATGPASDLDNALPSPPAWKLDKPSQNLDGSADPSIGPAVSVLHQS